MKRTILFLLFVQLSFTQSNSGVRSINAQLQSTQRITTAYDDTASYFRWGASNGVHTLYIPYNLSPTVDTGGISSLNGLVTSAQVFAVDTTYATSPVFVSSGSTHTLRIPMARINNKLDTISGVTKGSTQVVTAPKYWTARQYMTSLAVDTVQLKSTNKFVLNYRNNGDLMTLSEDADFQIHNPRTGQSVFTVQGSPSMVLADSNGNAAFSVGANSLLLQDPSSAQTIFILNSDAGFSGQNNFNGNGGQAYILDVFGNITLYNSYGLGDTTFSVDSSGIGYFRSYLSADSIRFNGTTRATPATWHSGIGAWSLGNITTGTINAGSNSITGNNLTLSRNFLVGTAASASTNIIQGAAPYFVMKNNDESNFGIVLYDLQDTTQRGFFQYGAGTNSLTIGNSTANTLVMDASGNITVGGTTGNATFVSDIAVNGADITTTATGTATVFNTNATTVNIAGAGTTVSIGASTGTTTINNPSIDVHASVSDTSAFTTTSTRKAVYISGATASDKYAVSIRNANGDDTLPVEYLAYYAKTDSLIVLRNAGTTSGLKFSYIRLK